MALLALPDGRQRTPVAVLRGWRSAARRRPLADLAYRLAVGVGGTATVLVGLVLVPLPGPGWPIVFVGLSLLGSEFAWAARLSRAVQARVTPAGAWLRTARWPWRAAATVGVVACAVVPLLLL